MSFRFYVAAAVIGLLVFVGLLVMSSRKASAAKASDPEKLGPDDLFLALDPEGLDVLLEDWRWKVGTDAKVFRVTVFGDIFTQSPGGQIHWLDTGSGEYVKVAESVEQWAEAAKSHSPDWFHLDVLRELRALDLSLKPGQVYSWRHAPMLGGTESVDNVDFVSIEVHVSFAGRVAKKIHDLPPGAKIEDIDFEVLGPERAGIAKDLYEVVINEELQYSMWPAGEQLPAGWKLAGKSGTKQECLDYIKEVWTDMRPLSLRKKLDAKQEKMD